MVDKCVNLRHNINESHGDAKIEEQRRGDHCESNRYRQKVDELGRIVLPVELRRTLDISERDPLEIYVDGASIVLRKFRPNCIFCNSSRGVSEFRGKNVCQKCLKELQSVTF